MKLPPIRKPASVFERAAEGVEQAEVVDDNPPAYDEADDGADYSAPQERFTVGAVGDDKQEENQRRHCQRHSNGGLYHGAAPHGDCEAQGVGGCHRGQMAIAESDELDELHRRFKEQNGDEEQRQPQGHFEVFHAVEHEWYHSDVDNQEPAQTALQAFVECADMFPGPFWFGSVYLLIFPG